MQLWVSVHVNQHGLMEFVKIKLMLLGPVLDHICEAIWHHKDIMRRVYTQFIYVIIMLANDILPDDIRPSASIILNCFTYFSNFL